MSPNQNDENSYILHSLQRFEAKVDRFFDDKRDNDLRHQELEHALENLQGDVARIIQREEEAKNSKKEDRSKHWQVWFALITMGLTIIGELVIQIVNRIWPVIK